MYYDRGASAPHRTGSLVLTADQVLHNGDVFSRSDGSGTRTPVSRTMGIIFLDESVKAGSGPPLLWELLHQTVQTP